MFNSTGEKCSCKFQRLYSLRTLTCSMTLYKDITQACFKSYICDNLDEQICFWELINLGNAAVDADTESINFVYKNLFSHPLIDLVWKRRSAPVLSVRNTPRNWTGTVRKNSPIRSMFMSYCRVLMIGNSLFVFHCANLRQQDHIPRPADIRDFAEDLLMRLVSMYWFGLLLFAFLFYQIHFNFNYCCLNFVGGKAVESIDLCVWGFIGFGILSHPLLRLHKFSVEKCICLKSAYGRTLLLQMSSRHRFFATCFYYFWLKVLIKFGLQQTTVVAENRRIDLKPGDLFMSAPGSFLVVGRLWVGWSARFAAICLAVGRLLFIGFALLFALVNTLLPSFRHLSICALALLCQQLAAITTFLTLIVSINWSNVFGFWV